jgi:dephospho-CoA kinase
MQPLKRGFCLDMAIANRILELSQISKRNQNQVVVRLLQIALEAIAPFDNVGLRRVLASSWQETQKIPALRRQLTKRSHGQLNAITATRLTMPEKLALRDVAEKNRVTMSNLQRQILVKLLTGRSP